MVDQARTTPDEGYVVSTLNAIGSEAVQVAVNQLEPDCVLLNSTTVGEYRVSWETAASRPTYSVDRSRSSCLPRIAQTGTRPKSEEGSSDRSRLAAFAAVIPKPFDVDVLLPAVARAVGRADSINSSASAEADRNARLRAKLEAAGASDVQTSARREWAVFRFADGTLGQVYWWEREGVYYVVRYSNEAPDLIGRFHDLGAAITLAMQTVTTQ